MDANMRSISRIPQHDATVILEALTTRGRDGLTMREAFDGVGMSVDTFYRRKKDFPDDVAGIERQAKEAASKARLEMLDEFSTRQLMASLEIQRQATEALLASIERLARIARGESEEVETADGERKVILTYPRDQIAAMRALMKIAGIGVLPKGHLVLPQNEEGPKLPPPSFPGLSFSRVQAIAPDGSVIVAERPGVTEGRSLPEEQPEARRAGNDTC